MSDVRVVKIPVIKMADVQAPALLPKRWVPKNEYWEIYKGTGQDYQERIILRNPWPAPTYIPEGWRISRLSKVSRSMLHAKWRNAIIAIEGN